MPNHKTTISTSRLRERISVNFLFPTELTFSGPEMVKKKGWSLAKGGAAKDDNPVEPSYAYMKEAAKGLDYTGPKKKADIKAFLIENGKSMEELAELEQNEE